MLKPMSDIEVHGLKRSIKVSKYPMSVDISKLDSTITPTVKGLGKAEKGSGHDNFLKGIIVQFDLTATNKFWVEAERYHWLEIVSSQSTMHRIAKFDLDEAYNEYVDPRVVEITKEKVAEYNATENKADRERKYLELLYTNAAGFTLTAGMTTNYLQLKTIYAQRQYHKLPEWKAFCKQLEELPLFMELCFGQPYKSDYQVGTTVEVALDGYFDKGYAFASAVNVKALVKDVFPSVKTGVEGDYVAWDYAFELIDPLPADVYGDLDTIEKYAYIDIVDGKRVQIYPWKMRKVHDDGK